MKHRAGNLFLYIIMISLAAVIVILSYKIYTRPHSIYATEDTAQVQAPIEEDLFESDSLVAAEPEEETTSEEDSDTMRGKTASTVNIRELDSTDSRVLKKVEKDFIFDIIEIQSNGWTKIRYEDSVAYISSDFVILIP